MKKITLVFAIGCLLFVKNVASQIKSADSLVNRAFNSIKNVDEQAYIKLFPTYPQLKSFFDDLVNSFPDSNQRAAMRNAFGQIDEEKYNSQIKAKVISSFQEFISNGRKLGIDWSQVRLDSFTSKEETPPNMDIKALAGNMYISYHDSAYVIPFGDVLWLKAEQGWVGFEMKKILKKGEEENEADEIIMKDEVVSDSVMVEPPPPPGIEKHSTKKPVNKTSPTKKPETKQPAKKPSTTTKPKSKS